MKTNFLSLAAIFAVALFSSNASAQTNTEATENTDAHAKLIKVMTITNANANGLDFGTIVLLTADASTVVLNAADAARTYDAGKNAAAVNATQTPNTADYNITGTPNESYAITLPPTVNLATTTTATGTDTEAAMTITLLKARANGAGSDAVVSTLSSTGTDSFKVGGQLNIKAAQIPGVYTGSFDVTVDYN